MTNDPTYQSLLRRVCEEPTNHQHKMVLADFLEDVGEYERCEAWRWPAENERAPVVPGWFPDMKHWMGFVRRSCLLPKPIFDLLPSKSQLLHWRGSVMADYQQAVEAFIAARREGWKPETKTLNQSAP